MSAYKKKSSSLLQSEFNLVGRNDRVNVIVSIGFAGGSVSEETDIRVAENMRNYARDCAIVHTAMKELGIESIPKISGQLTQKFYIVHATKSQIVELARCPQVGELSFSAK